VPDAERPAGRAPLRQAPILHQRPAVEALAVPKRTAAVRILLDDGSEGAYALFLAGHASHRDGPEEVADLLEEGTRFLPVRDLGAGGIAFLRCDAIAVVEVDATTGGDDPFALAPTEQHEVEVRLRGGRTVRGFVAYVLPPDRARVLDHLNEPGAWLALHGEGVLRLVHKRHVTRVDALES
jgi:hypothetical protein